MTRLLQANANQKGLELQSEVVEGVVIRGDRHRLRQVLLNLLGNAIKFTHSGFVKFSFRSEDDYLEFCVQDSGVGLSQPEKLFQPFSQLDTSSTRQFGGTGLGLAISLRLSELMKAGCGLKAAGCQAGPPPPGWVSRSSAQSAGSSFYLRIPLITAPPLPQEARSEGLEESEKRLEALEILVVEDNPVNQKVLRHLLDKMGHRYEVVEADWRLWSCWASAFFK